MARSIWKGPFVEESLIKKVEKEKVIQIKNQLKLGLESQRFYRILSV